MRNILLLLSVCFVLQLTAQNRWGKADPEEFSIRTCPFDSSANAMVLLDSAYVTVEKVSNPGSTMRSYNTSGTKLYTSYSTYQVIETEYTIYKRILILNKEGVANSNIIIPVITLNHYQDVSKLEAQTMNINDKGKIQISKVKDEAFFYDTLIKGAASTIKFTFPDVKEGSIIEYKYTLSVLGTQLQDWLFQGKLPTVRSAIELKIPDFAYCDMRFEGTRHIIKDKVEEYNDRFNNITGTKAHFAMNDIPAAKPEPFVPSPYDILDKIKFYSEKVNNVNGTITHTGWGTWQEWAKVMATYGKYFTPSNNVAWGFLAKAVVTGITDKAEKVKAVYNSLHTVMQWNKQYAISPTKSAFGKTENDSTGNSADINLILLSMLRADGIKAYPVLLDHRDHGRIDTSFCSPREVNNLIVMAELDSTEILLDATNKYSPSYLLPDNDLNGLGLKITDSKTEEKDIIKTEWVKIPASGNSSTTVSSVINIDSEGNYFAKAVFNAADYLALPYRDRPAGKSMTDFVKEYLKVPDDIDIKDLKAENEEDLDKKLKVVFNLEKKNSSPTDSFLYITPFPLKFYTDNPFNQSSRVNPISFEYGITRSLSCSITLPKNYKLVELPKPIKVVLDDGSAGFTLMVTQTDLNIQLLALFKVKSTTYGPEMFNEIKAIYAKMIDATNSLVVVQKM